MAKEVKDNESDYGEKGSSARCTMEDTFTIFRRDQQTPRALYIISWLFPIGIAARTGLSS